MRILWLLTRIQEQCDFCLFEGQIANSLLIDSECDRISLCKRIFLTELAVLYDPLQNNILLSLPPQPTATISYLTWFTW